MAKLLTRLRLDPFILSILGTVGLACLLPVRGVGALVGDDATKIAIGLLFFLYGARLSPAQAWSGARHWRLHLTVFCSTFLLFPLLGLAARLLVPGVLTPALYAGVVLLCAAPSTVQSSIAFTSIAKGNVAAAICSASFSSLIGIVLTPLLIAVLAAGSGGLSAASIGEITLQLLVPFLAGQLARRFIADWLARHKLLTAIVDRGSILLVVYTAFSAGVVAGSWQQLTGVRLLELLLVDAALLAIALLVTSVLARRLGFGRADRITIVFCGSKKSLSTGISMAGVLFAGHSIGLIVLPLMLFHQLQLMVCATLARRFAARADHTSVTETSRVGTLSAARYPPVHPTGNRSHMVDTGSGSPMTDVSAEHNQRSAIAARLNRLPITGLHRYLVIVVGLATFFDLYDLFLAGTVSTVLHNDFKLSTDDLKPLLASAFVGAFVGALTLGRLADRLGRRNAFLFTLSVYSVFTLVGAFSTNIWMLVICRFIAGIGIGGELPLADAYLADLLPASRRGVATAWAYTVGFCGVPAAGFIARGISQSAPLGLAGWRWLFIIGAVGAIIVWALRTGLPESPRWLAAVGRGAEAEAVLTRFEDRARAEGKPLPEPDLSVAQPRQAATRIGQLLRPPWARRTVMLYIFQILQAFGYYGFGTLVPIVLAAKGISVTSSLTFTALSFLGYPIGSALSIPIIERMQRKWLIVAGAIGMAVFGLLFGFATAPAAIVAFGFCYTAISNLFSNAFHTYQGELFPTLLRATAAGSAYSLSRLATAVMPYVLVAALSAWQASGMFAVVAVAMLLLVIDVAVLGPKTTGQPLEEIAGG